MLECLETELEALTKELEKAAPDLRPKGMGGLSYELAEREIGAWDRFNNRRQVGSYSGLCGGIRASGGSVRLLPISEEAS